MKTFAQALAEIYPTDADQKAAVANYNRVRTRALRKVYTKPFRLFNGPFDGATVNLETKGTAVMTVNGQTGRYRGGCESRPEKALASEWANAGRYRDWRDAPYLFWESSPSAL